MRATIGSFVASLVAAVAVSPAADAGPRLKGAEETTGGLSEPPRPSPELDKLKWLEGRWTCTGRGLASDFSTRVDTKGRIDIRRELGGHFLVGDFRQDKTQATPAVRGSWVVGHDGRQFSALTYDSTGGMATEKGGYQEGTLSLDGESSLMGRQMKLRESVTRRSDKEAVHVLEGDVDGTWKTLANETCRK